MTKSKICICGGGNLAHVVGGWLASRADCEVNILTRSPQKWTEDNTISITEPNGHDFRARFSLITSDAQKAVEGASFVLLCLPGFAIADVLESIKPYLNNNMSVGSIVSSSGFFIIAHRILSENIPLFGFQRVPFIARINEYGKSASLLGFKSSLAVATLNTNTPEKISAIFSKFFQIPVRLLDSPLKVTFTNSNPLLHPCRLYGLFNNKELFDSPVLFYEDWDNSSSQILIDSDNEFRRLLDRLNISETEIVPILKYYECFDAQSLTNKIRSIEAFKGLTAPMVRLNNGKYTIDCNTRYFTEDIPFGLLIIKSYAVINGIETPTIDKVLTWAQSKIGKQYLVNGKLEGTDINDTIVKYILQI